MKSTIKVLIIDDHKLMISGLKMMLSSHPSIKIVGTAANGDEGILMAKDLSPDVILMDIRMNGRDGLSATRAILADQPEIRIIGLTAHHAEPILIQIIQAGAKGYLTKSCPSNEIIDAIKTVMAGERYITPSATKQLALSPLTLRNNSDPFDVLSKQERQVMHYIVVKQLKAQQIADSLNLSSKTINTYRYRMFDKLGIRNDIELLHLAWHYGITAPSTADQKEIEAEDSPLDN